MGSSQSGSRRITIENPDETVIKITENVAERLHNANGTETSKPSTDKPKASVNYDVSKSPSADVIFLTSQEIRREVNHEIDKNNAYWENRMKALREGYRKINNELEEEYNTVVKELNQTLGKYSTSTDDTESCKQSQIQLIQCYISNQERPLLCTEEVQKFNACVTNRMNMVLKVK